LTRDGIPVLIHDPSIDRVTDGSGPVAGYTLAELQRFDAGYRFRCAGDPRHPQRGQGVVVPSLQETFEVFPNTRFNLELKAAQPRLVDAVVEQVVKFQREAITLLTASDDAIMEALRERLAGLPDPIAQGASSTDVVEFLRGIDGKHPSRPGPMALQIPVDYGGKALVTPELIERAHQRKLQVHVWTINEAPEMARLLDLGVDGIVTDYPGRMAEVLGARAPQR
jgi:glycerophosphoryl diester phosphodiesterase